MTTKIIPQNLGWMKVKRITIEITDCNAMRIRCRIYGTYLINKKEIKSDMFPDNDDFFISTKGKLIIESNESFRMFGKISIK